MKHPALVGAALAAAIALGAPAAALAGNFTLQLTPESDAIVGRPLIIQATGTVPPRDVSFPYWFSLDAIPTAVTRTCPPDRWEGAQFANANGGSIVVFLQSEKPGVTGRFRIPVAVTPRAPGSVLLCGYTDDGADATLAAASLMLHIRPASSRPPGPRTYAAQGIRSCRALLEGAPARSCIRKIVRRATARCRRLPSRRARRSCVRAVHRTARMNA
jgi:hypothetical protein